MSLWPHQSKALSEIKQCLADGYRSICVTSPCGGGKTRIACEHIIDLQREVCFYTHRKMLFSQTSQVLQRAGIDAGIQASGHSREPEKPVQVSMIQTVHRRLKGHRERPGTSGGLPHWCRHILVDEAHANKASQMNDLADWHFGNGCEAAIGLTATPVGLSHMYEHLIVAGTPSELRACGAHVPSYHAAPLEPDRRWIGKIKIGEGECGIDRAKRGVYAQRIFGCVFNEYHKHNPHEKPTILFAPGVPESIWFAKKLTARGVPTAHIDGKNIWISGELWKNTEKLRAEVREALNEGHIKIVTNRFVLREGIDWPEIELVLLGTVFGSLTAYLQATGRGLRASPGKEKVQFLDFGGNWWRHGSAAADRDWDLSLDDRMLQGIRTERIRTKQQQEPICCPQCNAIRLWGDTCYQCGYRSTGRTRPVLKFDGTLKQQKIAEFQPRRRMQRTLDIEDAWKWKVLRTRQSAKPQTRRRTFAQLEAHFAEQHNWNYPPRGLPLMPRNATDWFRSVESVPDERLF